MKHEASLGPQCHCPRCSEEKIFKRIAELEGQQWDDYDKLKAQNADLLETLEAVDTWLDKPLHNKESWPTKDNAMSAFKIGQAVKQAIRKAT